MMASLPLALLVLAALMTVVVAALPGPQWRKPICLLGALSSGAYIAWRWHSVANVDLAPPGQHSWVVFCFVVEAALVAEYWLFLLLCSRHRNRRGEADAHEARGDTPRVDVFIATRDEEAAILEKSILGALAMDYPDFTLHVLDDGRRDWLEALCAELGVHYVTRPDNSHKKAGNHNHALGLTDAPFIAVFDADFVPFRNFLKRTIGFFAEPTVGIVQTPQYFYNQDSVQTNLGLGRSLLDDMRFFFNRVMPCRDAWGVAFYCGSSAVLRRKAIEDIGGVVTGMATEDQATSAALLAAGWTTAYLDEPLSCGLAPESSFALLEQRKRWCRGGIQLVFKPFGPLGADTRQLMHRLLFLPSYWILGFMSPLFFLAECLACWICGWTPFVAVDPAEVMVGTVAAYVGAAAVFLWIGRGAWLPLLSPAIHLFLSFAVLPTALGTLVKPWGRPLLGILDVTPKGASALAGRVNWSAMLPLSAALAVLLAGAGLAPFVPLAYRSDSGENLVLSVWTGLLLVQVVLAMMVCIERRHHRAEARFELDIAATADGITCQVADLSLTGARLVGLGEVAPQRLRVFGLDLPCTARRRLGDGWGVELAPLPEQRRALIRALFTRPWSPTSPRLPAGAALATMLWRFVGGN